MKLYNRIIAVLAIMAVMTGAAVAQQNGGTETEGLKMKSYYVPIPDPDKPDAKPTGQHGNLILSSYVTGEQVITHTVKTQACDIVLVLDQSGSMSRSIESYSYNARSSQRYTYENCSKSYYYKDGDEYYEVSRGDEKISYSSYYYLFYNKGGSIYYLSGTGTTTLKPTNVKSKKTDIWTGVLYSRSSTTTTKLQALQNAVTAFVNQVLSNAVENNVDHRVAIVGFASTGNTKSDYTNTEILSLNNVVNYRSATGTNYKDALVSVKTGSNLNNKLTTAIGRLAADGDTYSEYGIDMANNIFAQHNTADEQNNRQRVVVMFTDGYTAPSGTDNIDYSMSDRAIAKAKISKTTYNAKVYTIGIFADANPNADFNTNFKYGSTTTAQQLVAANRYMHYVSSEYPYATDMKSKLDTLTHGSSACYMVANDASQLSAIFTKIAVSDITGGASVESVTKETVARGVLSPYFKFPDGLNENNIQVYVSKCNGENPNVQEDDFDALTFLDSTLPSESGFGNIGVTVDAATKTVSVTGFDYSENWCGAATDEGSQKANTTYRGYRLTIMFPVEIDEAGLNALWKDPDEVLDDLSRGKILPINTDISGLYSGSTGELLAPYPIQKQNIISPLPVELLSFNAECMDNAISFVWSTATETNNEYFTLECSEDAVNYKEIARIQGAGTSAMPTDYSFMTDNNTNRTMYYRLRQTDIDGTTEVFEPIAIQCNASGGAGISMYPVPARDYVNIQSNAEIASIQLYNVYGAMVCSMEINANTATVNTDNLAAGIYMVNITMANGEHISKKLIRH